jgi:outer membrane protein TolC
MDRYRLRRFARFLSPRRLALAGLPLLALGCAHAAAQDSVLAAPPAAAAPLTARGAAELPEPLAAPRDAAPANPYLPAPPPVEAHAPAKKLPISLDTVFRLAQDQNVQVQLAHERVNGAYAEVDLASLGWLPKLYVGPAWYRHEGGIQNEDGTLTHSSTGALFAGMEVHGVLDLREYAFEKVKAERDVWQQKGELSRISNETVQQASELYLDLLRARSEEDLAQRQARRQEELLQYVQKVDDPGLKAELATLEADLNGYRQLGQHMAQLQHAASARLVYLLGLDPCTELIPVDDHLLPFDLIDASAPVCDLVGRAVAAGPGVRELEGLLGLIQNSIDQANGPSRLLPVFEVRMAEGGFGAGAGDSLTWDNRWDLGLQARWDLSGLATGKATQRLAESKLQQASLSLQDLRGKLTAGVQESREAVLRNRDQLPGAQKRIDLSADAYRLHNELLRQTEERRSLVVREMVQNIRMLREAEHEYLETLSAYDKAQVRLILLLGPTAPPPACAGVAPGR